MTSSAFYLLSNQDEERVTKTNTEDELNCVVCHEHQEMYENNIVVEIKSNYEK